MCLFFGMTGGGCFALQVTLQNDCSSEIITIDMPTANLLGPQEDSPEDTELDTPNDAVYQK